MSNSESEVVKQLEWYKDYAEAIHRAMSANPPQTNAMLASMTALSLDGGKRASDAIALIECKPAQERKPPLIMFAGPEALEGAAT